MMTSTMAISISVKPELRLFIPLPGCTLWRGTGVLRFESKLQNVKPARRLCPAGARPSVPVFIAIGCAMLEQAAPPQLALVQLLITQSQV